MRIFLRCVFSGHWNFWREFLAGMFHQHFPPAFSTGFIAGIFAGHFTPAFSAGIFPWRFPRAFSACISASIFRLHYPPEFSSGIFVRHFPPGVFAGVFLSAGDSEITGRDDRFRFFPGSGRTGNGSYGYRFGYLYRWGSFLTNWKNRREPPEPLRV